jgi:hypothetical protein
MTSMQLASLMSLTQFGSERMDELQGYEVDCVHKARSSWKPMVEIARMSTAVEGF